MLSNISKIYERLLYNQLQTQYESVLSPYQCGFRKDLSILATFLSVIEKWRESLDQGGIFGAILTDFLKSFDCLSHDLLIATLNVYGLDSYLTKRRQIVKINNTHSSWSEILLWVLQGSVLFQLLFKYFWVNPNKLTLLIGTNEEIHVNGSGIELSNSKSGKLFVIKFVCKLTFDTHAKSLCKKAIQKFMSL